MKSWSGVLLALGGLSMGAGCSDPPGIVPVAPPGMEYRRVPPPSSGGGAEALGETPAGVKHDQVVSTLVSEPTPIGESKKTNSGLVYETLKPGTGAVAQPGQTVKVNYVGKLIDGKKFDASADHGGPLELVVGMGRVIKGWDEGLPGMKIGEKRRLIIPPDMGYGSKGVPPTIPADSTLVFEVELLEAK